MGACAAVFVATTLRLRAMRAEQIRETFLEFFERRGHRRLASASLVPSVYDPSVLLTTAGMQPLKPYFRGEEEPPARRLTSCQRCFRTTDIDNVGRTARHLTFFEMLGNFSIGDYFKREAIEYAYELSTEGFGFDPERIWITVFGGDPGLGLGPDEEAIEYWRAVGIPEDRIVRLGRDDNFWQAGPTGPCGPCSELYYDRGPQYGADSERPGDDTDRFLEFWNLVFMQYELHPGDRLSELPQRNIDTGAGLERLAALLQGVPSVFESDLFRPLVELGEELSGRRYGEEFRVTRALRIIADHGRGATFLLADGVVPSNEERGYVLRRIMRRTVLQGRVLGIDRPLLEPLYERVIETMSGAWPYLRDERPTILRWARTEEENFARTIEQGRDLLEELIARAKREGASEIDPEDAFRLHDTFGFPFELTRELLAEEGLSVDEQAVRRLMERAREVARRGASKAGAAAERRERAAELARASGAASRFVGYERLATDTKVLGSSSYDGQLLVKLAESPFYAEGGGQVSDTGSLAGEWGRARVLDAIRLPDDQVLVCELLEGRPPSVGAEVHAQVDEERRRRTMRNHTATHLLHAALRRQLGSHVRQAGSYVGPDKLRFDFTHGKRLGRDEVEEIQGLVNAWVEQRLPVRAFETTREEANRLGAIALFGEKYGDWVRVVEIDDVSRELCGGTHVASSAEIGLFEIEAETSSASNVRRIEAVTGPAAAALFAQRSATLARLSELLRVPEQELVSAVERLQRELKEARKRAQSGDGRAQAERIVASAQRRDGTAVVVEAVEGVEPRALVDLADAVRQKLGRAVVLLATSVEGRAHLVASVAPELVEAGLRADQLVREAGAAIGGGGGGRPTMAQAGARDAGRLAEALEQGRAVIERALG